MKNIAIIPARGGSKRIPRKNIREFMGKPIIAYSIEKAIDCRLFDEIMVSTEDEEIAAVAKGFGAKVPFLRSSLNANDFATLADVIFEVINNYATNDKTFDTICCILPTAPLVSIDRIIEALDKLESEHLDSVFPVVEYSYPILRALEFSCGNKLQMIWPEYMKARSQDLKPAYHDAGAFYWVRNDALIKEKTLLCEKCGAIELSEVEVQDIDDEDDWKYAEIKYKMLLNDY
jgi:N-acylneuraminate cytidylyltransferase